jgi:hypothetical protein
VAVNASRNAGKQPADFVLDPVENGLDFMGSVVDRLEGNPTAPDLKYGILHLCAAIEVLFKARLLAEDWELVFESPAAASEEALRSGAFKSVGIKDAITRLADLGVFIPDEARKAIRLAFDKRNAIAHFGLRDSTEAVRAIAVEALSFLISFLHKELREWEPEQTSEALEGLRERVRDIAGFVEARMRELGPALDRIDVVLMCPDCTQMTLEPDQVCTCHFCFREGEPEDVAEDYISIVFGENRYLAGKGRTGWSLHTCPECERETLVGGVENRNARSTFWCCFAEGWGVPRDSFSQCERCDELAHAGVDDLILCNNCIENWIFAAD